MPTLKMYLKYFLRAFLNKKPSKGLEKEGCQRELRRKWKNHSFPLFCLRDVKKISLLPDRIKIMCYIYVCTSSQKKVISRKIFFWKKWVYRTPALYCFFTTYILCFLCTSKERKQAIILHDKKVSCFLRLKYVFFLETACLVLTIPLPNKPLKKISLKKGEF